MTASARHSPLRHLGSADHPQSPIESYSAAAATATNINVNMSSTSDPLDHLESAFADDLFSLSSTEASGGGDSHHHYPHDSHQQQHNHNHRHPHRYNNENSNDDNDNRMMIPTTGSFENYVASPILPNCQSTDEIENENENANQQQEQLNSISSNNINQEQDEDNTNNPNDGNNEQQQQEQQYSPLSTWRLENTVNGVHMELQENAKISTVYWPVNRMGSALNLMPAPGVGAFLPRQASQQQQQMQQQQQNYPSASSSTLTNSWMTGQQPQQNTDTTTTTSSGTNWWEDDLKPSVFASSDDTTAAVGAAAGDISMNRNGTDMDGDEGWKQQQSQQQQRRDSIDWNNLTELFLTPHHRSGYHATYAQAGILSPKNADKEAAIRFMQQERQQQEQEQQLQDNERMDEDTIMVEKKTDSFDMNPMNEEATTTTSSTLDDLLAAVDPTPLSEIRRRHEEQQERRQRKMYWEEQQQQQYVAAAQQQQEQQQQSILQSPPLLVSSLPYSQLQSQHQPSALPLKPKYQHRHYRQQQQQQQHPPQYYYRGGQRPNPLPIPVKNVSPPTSPTTTTTNMSSGTNLVVTDNNNNNNNTTTTSETADIGNAQQQQQDPQSQPPQYPARQNGVHSPTTTTATAGQAVQRKHHGSHRYTTKATTPPPYQQNPYKPLTALAPSTSAGTTLPSVSTSPVPPVAPSPIPSSSTGQSVDAFAATAHAHPPASQQMDNTTPTITPSPVMATTTTTTASISQGSGAPEQQQQQLAPPPPPLPPPKKPVYTRDHSAAHAVPRGAIQRASKQKSQYGFGTNHVVPSVPVPPVAIANTVNNNNNNNKVAGRAGARPMSATTVPVAAAAKAPRAPKAQSGHNTPVNDYPLHAGGGGGSSTTSSNAHAVAPSSSSVGSGGGGPGCPNSGLAYERKKQRAKDARVRLNESIENLGISISLAGTQSKRRISQWKHVRSLRQQQQQQLKQESNGSSNDHTLAMIQDCVETAESAKKWDRPSFVGTAAALIAGLNAQCDALMRELMLYHNNSSNNNPTSSSVETTAPVVPSSATSRPPTVISTSNSSVPTVVVSQNNGSIPNGSRVASPAVPIITTKSQEECNGNPQNGNAKTANATTIHGPASERDVRNEVTAKRFPQTAASVASAGAAAHSERTTLASEQTVQPVQPTIEVDVTVTAALHADKRHSSEPFMHDHVSKRPRIEGKDTATSMAETTIAPSVQSDHTNSCNDPVTMQENASLPIQTNGIVKGQSPEATFTAESDDGKIIFERKVLEHVASFLDPVSMIRCMKVCKEWRGIFSNDTSWLDLATVRFGFFNIRQWKEKMEDEDEGVLAPAKTLYKSMDAANVMPHFPHDGMFLLGEARLPGKVSAWTFLVERSNGETLRSVQRDPSTPGPGKYTSLPVVELRTVIQNTGVHHEPIILREQVQTVDASTRRRGEEMKEIDWDERFQKRILNLDGTPYVSPVDENRTSTTTRMVGCGELCRLRLYETVVLNTFILARGCTTTSKFVQRANFTKVLVYLNSGVTVPLVITFPRDAAHLLH